MFHISVNDRARFTYWAVFSLNELEDSEITKIIQILLAGLRWKWTKKSVPLGYLMDTFSGFEAVKPAPWPSPGLHHRGKLLEP